jgi:hypothetical protein
MDRDESQGILDQLLKGRPGALPAFPVLAGCLLLMVWISFGIRILVIWTGDPASQSGQFLQFIADPLAALIGSSLLTYLIKSTSTRGGMLLGLLAIPLGWFFSTVLSGGAPELTPLLIFQIVLTYLLGWFGGSLASGQFAERLKHRRGLASTARPVINRSSAGYRKLLGHLGGNETTARRLIAHERSKHPDHNGEQLIQDALDSLSRDRNRS